MLSEDKINFRRALFKRQENIIFYHPLTIKLFAETIKKPDYPGLLSSKNPYFSKKNYIF